MSVQKFINRNINFVLGKQLHILVTFYHAINNLLSLQPLKVHVVIMPVPKYTLQAKHN